MLQLLIVDLRRKSKLVIYIKDEEKALFDDNVLAVLLKDRTTDSNIKWGTDFYASHGMEFREDKEITLKIVKDDNEKIIKSSSKMEEDRQLKRKQDKAEVFTPSWVCNIQNNLIDEAYFNSKNIFNKTIDKSWTTNKDKVIFPENHNWKEYVCLVKMEITCGESPYLVSRYDTVSGDPIEIQNRIGILDRKLRIISENVNDKKEWVKWAVQAYKSCYGYDFQGDNVYLSRINLLMTFIEYMNHKFNQLPSKKNVLEVANIISWNLWQMDGITLKAPYSKAKTKYEQLSLFDTIEEDNIETEEKYCEIFDWEENKKKKFINVIN